MTKIYVANATKQTLRHLYRLPESTRVFSLEIGSGRQELVGERWSPGQQEAFIRQLDQAGFRQSQETNRKLEEFSGWLYSLGKPVGETDIYHGHEAVVEHQEARSASEAQKAAMAFDMSNRPQKDRRKRLAKVTQVEVQQDVGPGKSPTGNEITMSVTFDENSNAQLKV